MAGLHAAAVGAGFSAASFFQCGLGSGTGAGAHGRVQPRLCVVRAGEGVVSKRVVRARSSSGGGTGGNSGAAAPPAAKKMSSIQCQSCDGNGAVACSQCHGSGVNTEDHFNGRFKAGQMCWLCRGKRQMLCGSCNGAGFMGGFMNTQDE